MRELLVLGRMGLSGCILRDFDDDPRLLRRALTHLALRTTVSTVGAPLLSDVGREMDAILRYVLRHCSDSLSVNDVARGLGIDRRTLYNHCRAAGAPPPQAVIGWCRLLAAAVQLDDPGRDVDHIACSLHFASGSALRNQFRRYTGLTTSQLRASGAVSTLMASFRRAMSSSERSDATRMRLFRDHMESGGAAGTCYPTMPCVDTADTEASDHTGGPLAMHLSMASGALCAARRASAID